MNREIKFRGETIYNEVIYGFPFINPANEWSIYIPNKGSFVLKRQPDQFIGLKDKNGIDIYENDFLQNPDKGYFNPIFLIEYDKYKFTIPLNTDKSPMSNKLIIIGNIHENPELL